MRQSIVFSIAGRAVSMASTFLVIPLLLLTMGQSDYGVWVTLTSIVGWFLIFDFGFGNVIRNRVAAVHGSGAMLDPELSRTIAGTLQIYGGIAMLLAATVMIAGLLVEPLKTHIGPSLLLYSAVIVSFPLSISTAILQGRGSFVRLSAFTVILPIGWLGFAVIAALLNWTTGLTSAAVAYALLLLLQNGLMSVEAFTGSGITRPMLFDLRNAREAIPIVRIGLRFFGVQLCTVVLFYAGNFISFQHLTSAEVARFDTVNKVFLIFTAVLNIVTSVVWTEIAKAKVNGDHDRSRRLFRVMLVLALTMSAGGAWATAFIHSLSGLVSRGHLSATSAEAWPFATLMALQSFTFAGAVFLNAYEMVFGQLLFTLLAIPIFLFGSVYFFDTGWGISSVPIATSIAIIPLTIYCLASAHRLIDRQRIAAVGSNAL